MCQCGIAVACLLRNVRDVSHCARARERARPRVLHHPGSGDMSLADGGHPSVSAAHPPVAGDEPADDAGSDAGVFIHAFLSWSLWPNSADVHFLLVKWGRNWQETTPAAPTSGYLFCVCLAEADLV